MSFGRRLWHGHGSIFIFAVCWFLIEKDVMLQRLYTGGI